MRTYHVWIYYFVQRGTRSLSEIIANGVDRLMWGKIMYSVFFSSSPPSQFSWDLRLTSVKAWDIYHSGKLALD